MFVMIAGVAAYVVDVSFLKDVLDQIHICDDYRCGCNVVIASCLKDVLDEMNVCDDCRCWCVRRKRMIFERY